MTPKTFIKICGKICLDLGLPVTIKRGVLLYLKSHKNQKVTVNCKQFVSDLSKITPIGFQFNFQHLRHIHVCNLPVLSRLGV
jgi:hypothetical protein